MKNLGKSILFIFGFIFLYIALSYLFLPKVNLKRFGLYNTSLYEILGENPNTVDVIVLGDSLVYSSISPMDIYGKYGYTVFACAEPAQILSDTYHYFDIALKSQNPKVVLMEANILFRDANKRPWYNRPLKIAKNSLPLVTYHNNWKKLLFDNHKINSWSNISKGYKKNTDINPSYNYDYMKESERKANIPSINLEYFNKIVDACKKNNIKLILIGLPSQKSWYYTKHMKVEEISKEYNLEYINYNFDDIIHIDWESETKDQGSHLNYSGAKKISDMIGNYLESLNIIENHKNKKGYEEWDKAYRYYSNS